MDYRHFFTISEDSTILCIWSTGKYALRIIYDINKPHLSANYPKYSYDSLQNYILNNLEEAFYSAVDKIGEDCYELNIASNLHFHGSAGDDVYKSMLNTFMPIIQKFMADALTDNLKNKE